MRERIGIEKAVSIMTTYRKNQYKESCMILEHVTSDPDRLSELKERHAYLIVGNQMNSTIKVNTDKYNELLDGKNALEKKLKDKRLSKKTKKEIEGYIEGIDKDIEITKQRIHDAKFIGDSFFQAANEIKKETPEENKKINEEVLKLRASQPKK